MGDTAKWIGGVLASLAVLVALIVGGWALGWWMTAKSTDYQAHIFQHSYGAQAAYVQQLSQAQRDVAGIDVQITDPNTPADERAALRAQRLAVINQACDIASRITSNLPASEQQFVAANCSGGSQ